MTKAEIKKVPNNELLTHYIRQYAMYDSNYVLNRGTTRLEKHLKDLEAEIVARGILSEHDIEVLNF